MKIFLTVAFLSCFSIYASGQKADKEIRDAVNLQCSYAFAKKLSGDQTAYRTDTMRLDIGKKVSRFYDPARQSRDSAIFELFNGVNQQNIKTINVYKGSEGKDLSKLPGTVSSNATEGESYQIIRHLDGSGITVFDQIGATGATKLQYEDKLGKLNWEILSGTDTVAGYACKKAQLKFRGRTYTAWFSTDIPINEGPWKFSGLPGLILKAEDTDQLFSFTLIGMMQPKTELPLLVTKSDYLKCAREECNKQLTKRGMGMQVHLSNGDMSIAEISGKYQPVFMELE